MKKCETMKLIKYLPGSLIFFCVLTVNSYGFIVPQTDRLRSYVVIDYNTGDILSEANSQEKMYPASLTKLMTLFILFDKLDEGSINLDSKIKISQEATRLPPSRLGLPAGSTIAVKDAIVSVIVRSNNDIAHAIGEHIGGSKQGFVNLMNQKAKELGLTGTHFSNPHGLHDKNNYSTAYDMAKLSRILMIQHNAYYSLFSISDFNWNKTRYSSTNKLLEYNGIDGIKTGYTGASGFNLVTSASKDNTRIIAVVMGFNTANGRDDYMKQVIDVGFEIAEVTRKNEVMYVSKPDNFKNNLIDTPSLSLISNNGERESSNNTSSPDDFYSMNLSNVNLVETNNLYTIDRVPYVDDLSIKAIIKIAPNVKMAKKSSAKGKYSIQVGAFSNYHSALRTSYNVANISATSHILKKNKIIVTEKEGIFVARFKGLTKEEAQSSCKTLKTKGSDCFMVTG